MNELESNIQKKIENEYTQLILGTKVYDLGDEDHNIIRDEISNNNKIANAIVSANSSLQTEMNSLNTSEDVLENDNETDYDISSLNDTETADEVLTNQQRL